MRSLPFCFSLVFALISCSKLPVEEPDLQITTSNTQVKLGDTTFFNLSGYADYINFYSGETGRNYYRKDSNTATSGAPEFQFMSNVQTGATTINNLSVLVSTDFDGVFTAPSVTKASWTNITGRLTLGTSATNVSSGVVNLNDLKVEGKPMYVAFRYNSTDPATLKQRQWTISTFQFRTRFPSGDVYTHAASNADAGFGTVGVAGDSANWVSGTSLTHVGLNAGFPGDDDWAISRSFDLNRIASDAAGVTVVKNLALTGVVPPVFSWVYTKPGTYKAVFVVRNANRSGNKELIKEFVITVNP